MSKIKTLILIIALSSSLTGCIPDPLDVDGLQSVKPQIVVSTQIIPDESLVVLLTRSFGALDANEDSDAETILRQIAVNDAVVIIQSENSSDTLSFLGNGAYGGIQIPFISGVQYTLIAESESLGKVTAVTDVKPRISFSKISTSMMVDEFSDTITYVSYDFPDPPGKNWYLLNIIKVNRAEIIENVLDPREYTRLISDDTEVEGQYFDTIQLSNRFSPGDTIAVYLSNVNEDYFDFMELRRDSRFSLVEYISEPVNYPSNVQGGKGFFNLYLPDIELEVLD
jgi:hypothetical protein